MDISYKYAYMGNTILVTMFYLPILPIGVVFSFVGMFLMYFIEKYNVLNKYRRPEKIDGRITRTYVAYFPIAIFVYALSTYIFFGGIHTNRFNWELIGLIMFGILSLLPIPMFLRKIKMLQVVDGSNDDYDNYYFEIGVNYQMANPLTKSKGFEQYLVKLLETNMISDKEYQENIIKISTEPSDILELFYKKKYGDKTNKKKVMAFKGLMKKHVYNSESQEKSNIPIVNRISTLRRQSIQSRGSRGSKDNGNFMINKNTKVNAFEVDNKNNSSNLGRSSLVDRFHTNTSNNNTFKNYD